MYVHETEEYFLISSVKNFLFKKTNGINFMPFVLQKSSSKFTIIFIVFLKRYRIKQTVSLSKHSEGYETKTSLCIFCFSRKQMLKQKAFFKEMSSFDYKCKSQPCVLILSNNEAR